MRASRPLLLLVLSAVLALTACTEPAEPAGATRTVLDMHGTEVEVPESPERIVALSEPTLDALLALDIAPIGTVTGRGQSTIPSYLAEVAPEIELLGGVSQPNYEAIGDVDPDLILVDGTSINNNADAIEALRRIAPVVETGLAGGDWRSNFTLVADAVNRAEDGEAVLAAYDARVAELSSQLAPVHGDDTFSIVRWQGGSPSMILKELPAGRALTDLGLQRPPNQDTNGRGHSVPVSVENLPDIDADFIFFGTLGGSSVDNPDAGGASDVAAAQDALDAAEQVPGFTALEAYRAGQIVLVDGSAWTSTGGPLLMNRIIEDVAGALLP